MKTLNNTLLFALAGALLMFSSCKNNSISTETVQGVDEYFTSLPDWETNASEPEEDVFKDSIKVSGPDPNTEGEDCENCYECSVFDRNMVATISNFVSVGTNNGKIWPGAMIQGKSLKTGELKLIQANGKRADITLTTDIALEEGSKTITPNSVEAQQAIADFMIASGGMPEGSKAGAGETYFRVEEATTFNQSMRQMGFSAGFTEPQSQVGLDGSLEVERNRSSHTHTVAAQYVQEKFKVRIADDLIATPSDFFTKDFTSEDLQQMQQNGEIGPDNIPLYIEEVTYGRILLFSKKSERVTSANKLAAALEASMANYANTGGNVDEEDEEILTSASNRIYSAGGSETGANAAVASLNWSEFFVETDASEAIPISFVARTLNGKKVVGLVSDETYEYRGSCSVIEEFVDPPDPEVESYSVTVEWTETNNSGLCAGSTAIGTCSPAAYTNFHENWSFTRLTVANGYKKEFTIYPDQDPEFTIRSTSRLRLPWPWQGLTQKSLSNTYNITRRDEGTFTVRHQMSNIGGSTELVYQVTKTTNYKEKVATSSY